MTAAVTEPSAEERATAGQLVCERITALEAALAEKDAEVAHWQVSHSSADDRLSEALNQLATKDADLAAARRERNEYLERNSSLVEKVKQYNNRALALEAALAAKREILQAATHALRSYQYGNGSPDLAKATADALDAALASSPGAAWLAWARGVLPLLSAVTKMVEEIKAAAPEGEMVKRWVEDAGECARALLARAPEGVRS